MKNKKISILGSTGSIGKNVLKVAASFPESFTVVGLTAGWNIDLLREQVEAFSPLMVSVAEEEDASRKARHSKRRREWANTLFTAEAQVLDPWHKRKWDPRKFA